MSAAPPPVSVLLPVRDAAPYLSEALDSLQAQTLADFEVVAVDDGSTDGSRAILHERAAADSRIRVLTQPPTGIVAALERARQAARGRFLARMDADDVTGAERLELQMARASEDPRVVACGCRVEYFPEERVRGGARRYQDWLNRLTSHERIERELFVECPLAHPTLFLRADAVDGVGGYQERGWPEDYDLVLRLWRAGGRLANEAEATHRWREREGRMSRTSPAYSLEAFRECKVHHLSGTLLQGRDGVVVWGAGPTGKALARTLIRRGIQPRAFVELDRRKIGQQIHGAPVVRPEDVERYRGALCLAAVSGAFARAEIRASLTSLGWREMEDFVALA